MTRRLLTMVLGLGLSVQAMGQEPPPPPPAPAPVLPTSVPARVSVSVQVVRATNQGDQVDPRLQSLLPSLQRMPFSNFQIVDEQAFRLADGKSGDVGVGGGRTVRVSLARHDNTQAHVEIHYQRSGGDPVETSLTIRRDRAFLYALRTGDPNEALLLKVDVRY